MGLSEHLNCPHFEVVAGQAPSIQKLDKQTDDEAHDWADASATGQNPTAPRVPVGAEELQVQAAVLRIWDLFKKEQDSSVCREEYENFVKRVGRVLLPGLSSEQERVLAASTWDEGVGNAANLTFANFYQAATRLAKMWTDTQSADMLAGFLEDIRLRVTRARVQSAETGEETEIPETIVLTFEGQNGNLDWMPPESEFMTSIVVEWKGKAPLYQFDVMIGNESFVQTGSNYCWYTETAHDAVADADLSQGAVRRVWADLESITPLGRAVLIALQQVNDSMQTGPIDIDLSDMQPAPESPMDGARILLSSMLPSKDSSVALTVNTDAGSKAKAVVQGSGHEFGIQDLLGAGLTKDNKSNTVIVAPVQNSMLYKLDLVRRGVQLAQPRAALAAAQPGVGGSNALGEEVKLPTFPGMLKNELELNAASGLAKPVRVESLIESGSLAALAEAYINNHAADMPNSLLANDNSDLSAALSTQSLRRTGGAAFIPGKAFVAGFPVPQEGLRNNETDLLTLANTSPVAMWIVGQCDGAGEYKTEVCRRLADHLGLEWLKPTYLLELAVKTPEKYRTKLMQSCVGQLQRGMTVSISDTLSLTLEMMDSARCRTNGYVLDFPPLGPEDTQVVANFAQKVLELSGAKEVQLEGLFDADLVQLPPLKAEPKPPAPPPAEGEEGEAPAEGDAPPAEDPEAPPEGEAPAEGEGEEGGEAAEGEQPPPKPLPPLKPNPFANVMPRRLLFLSMEEDEVKAWRVALLKAQHAEKERRRKELEEAGEEVPEEEEAEPEELPTLPEDEAELDELFEKGAGDLLRTMAPFAPPPSLEPPAKLPPIPDESQDIDPETEDRATYKAGEEAAVKALREKHALPLLRLHADSRDPVSAAALLQAASGGFRGTKVPLPKPLEGAGDEPKELLRLELDEKQASRRWAQWQLHCPVSLYDKTLVAGDKEFAVEYAGYVFLFADVVKQRRFCSWPKKFLTDAPRINAPGMHLGYILAGPCGYRCSELANRMHDIYGFDVIDVAAVISKAMELEPIDAGVEDPDAADDEETVRRRSSDAASGPPRLMMSEKASLLAGGALGVDTLVRLIAGALKIEDNIKIIKDQKEAVEAAKKALEEAEAAGAEKPGDIVLNDDGEPVVELAEPLRQPERGFVLIGFPETAEQLQALQAQTKLAIERVLILKMLGEDAPELAEFLAKKGLGEVTPLAPVLEAQLANFDSIAGIEDLRVEEVPMEAEENEQVVHIRKLIDPFYPVVTDPAMAADIPDPDEFNLEDAMAAAADEDGNVAEIPEPPVIPWGTCGPYCPVTLKEDFWLFPGQKEFQHSFGNRVYAVASEKVSADFLAEPERFVPQGREPSLPPPRVLVTGPTGSTVARQCELLSKVYHIPVMKLEEAWRKEVEKRLDEVKAAKKKKEQDEAHAEKVLLGDDGPAWPDGWVPKEPVEGEEEAAEEAAPEEQEPEEDGLDDEQREELFVQAMRTVLGSHCGACIIDGTWFGDLENEEMGEEVKTARSLQNLLFKARRLPDVSILLRCKHDLAFSQTHDAAAIDAEDEELCTLAKAQDAAGLKEKLEAVKLIGEERKAAFKAFLEELQGTEEEGPPDPLPEAPEDLIAAEEKESDRAKAKFIEKKKLEQEALKAFAERLVEARHAPRKVAVDRGEEPAHKSVRWHCRQFMEQRSSLLLRHQVAKVSPSMAKDLTNRALAMPSVFKDADPMCVDVPLYTGRPDTFKHVAELRGRLYYPRSGDALQKFLEQPQDYIHLSQPSRIAVQPAIAIIGPPLSGKTTLARELAERTGAVYLTIPEVLTELCSPTTLPSALSREIKHYLRRGSQVPDENIIEALRYRLASPDVLQRGWVLDDFPLTEPQAQALQQAGIVPHRLLVINVPEGLIFTRANKLGEEGNEIDLDLVQQEPALQRQRLDAYERNAPLVRCFYGLTYDNVRDIDGSRSAWAMYDHALKETSHSVSQRLEYYRRTSKGLSARVHGMCFTPQRMIGSESVWRKYCPVALTLSNELVQCRDSHFTVEYKSKIYWLSSEEHTKLFMSDPESFLQVQLPAAVPQLLSATERRSPVAAQLEEYCAVALVDRKELVKATGHHLIRFMSKVYSFSSQEAAQKFMRRPMRYVQRAKLPSKRPALKGEHQVSLMNALQKGREGRGLEPADMLTFMQASVAELICQALVDSGEKRPLYPGKTARESALLFLAKFLRAKNPVSTDMFATKVRGELEAFLADCALPARLGKLSEEQAAMEADGTWTSSDARLHKELCSRFDEIFGLSP